MENRRWQRLPRQMKVFQVNAKTELLCQAKDKKFLGDENLSGRPFPGKWRRVELLLENGTGTPFDFYGFGSKALVCSEQVRLWCGPFEDEGEFLPVKIKGLKGRYYLYNVTHCASHLNPRKTLWATDKRTGLRTIKSPAFHAERLGEDCVFKIPEDGATAIYALERDDFPEHESLKTLVERHGLTGLKFKLVWTDKKPMKGSVLGIDYSRSVAHALAHGAQATSGISRRDLSCAESRGSA